MVWDRRSVQRGLTSLKTCVPYQDNYQARGRKKIEVILQSLAEDIRDLVEGDAQVDPTFGSEFRYLKVSAQAVRDALITKKGYADDVLPSRQAIGRLLNRLGYRLRKPSRRSH